MSNQSFDEIEKVIDLIYKGKINYELAKKMLDQIDSKYDRPFLLAKPNPQKRPWNIKYLRKLRHDSYNGYRSKECLLHFAEVADEVYAKRRKAKKRIGIIVSIVGVIAIIISIFAILNNK